MKANELMIGDWVLYNGKPVKVLQLSDGKDYKNITPIPLTPEILEKNGLVKCIGGRSKKSLQLIGDGLYVSWWNDRIVIRYKRVLGHPSAYLNCDCRYVHELQHALRLVGVDKEITI